MGSSSFATSLPFAVLERGRLACAISEVSSKFAEIEPYSAAERCHDAIALPLQRAMAGGSVPELLATLEGDNATHYFVGLGQQLFLLAERHDFQGRKLVLCPPVSRSRLGVTVDAKDLKRLAKELLDKEELRIALFRRDCSPTTGVKFGATDWVHRDISYGWALWETAVACLRKAAEAEKRKQSQIEGASAQKPLPGEGAAAKQKPELLATLAKPGNVPATAGPLFGDDLVDATGWRGQPVGLTSFRDGQSAMALAVMERLGNETRWRPIMTPDGPFPRRGATLLIEGDVLHLFGGLDAKGEPSKTHWRYDLARGSKDGFSAAHWRRNEMSSPAAWAVAAKCMGAPMVIGGVAGYWLTQRPEAEPLRTAESVRTAKALLDFSWRTRAPAPGPVTGASVVATRDCLLIGPGADCTGKLYAYDARAEGAWYVLPELPEELGLGQVHLEGHKLVYAGGFDKAGKVSRSIYELDLDREDQGWRKVGSSDYVAGTARVVESDGRWVSIMVTPKGSRCFHLG